MKKMFIGNLKMNMTKGELIKYFNALKKYAKSSENTIGVAVPFPYLYLAQEQLKGTNILIGAQDVYFQESGAYTGEVSVGMLKDFGTDFCIVGHSERRNLFGENYDTINKKVTKLCKTGITPVMCIGETLKQRAERKQKYVVRGQLDSVFNNLAIKKIKKVIVAYEPVWAIGTGKNATPDQVQEIASYIKDYVVKKYGLSRKQICVLYGGSINETNCNDLLNLDDVDGGLIGGACLNAENFSKLFL